MMARYRRVGMKLDLITSGETVSLFVEFYAPEDIDREKMKDIVMKIAELLYKNFETIIELDQPTLIEREYVG